MELHADKSEVLRYLGYRGQGFQQGYEDILENSIARARLLARPRCVSRYFVYDGVSITDGGPIALPGKDIRRFLEGAQGCILMAVTLGAEIDMELRRLQGRRMIEAVTFDAAATALVEDAAGQFQGQLADKLRREGKLLARGRFSPGYGDLPLEFQQQVSRLLDMQRRIGVSLTENNLMVPMKSITAFAGVFISQEGSSCEIKTLCEDRTAAGTARKRRGYDNG